MSFKRDERIAQLKACAECIINNAENIIGSGSELPIDWKVIIDMQCNRMPTVKVEKHILPPKLFNGLK